MRFFIFILSVFFIISGAESATSVELLDVIPGHENECYDKASDKFYKNGEVIENNSEKCYLRYCGKYDNLIDKILVHMHTCGVVKVTEEYELKQDLTLPYPDCCPQPYKKNCPDVSMPE